jgi:hypothetical protein
MTGGKCGNQKTGFANIEGGRHPAYALETDITILPA